MTTKTENPLANFHPAKNKRAWNLLLSIVDGTFTDYNLPSTEQSVLQSLLDRALVNLTDFESGVNVYNLTYHGRRVVAHYQMESPTMLTETQKNILNTLKSGPAHIDRRQNRAAAVLREMAMINRLADGRYDLLPAGSQYLADGTLPEREKQPKKAGKPFTPPMGVVAPVSIWQTRAENGEREIARQKAIIESLKQQLSEAQSVAETSAPNCLNCEITGGIQDAIVPAAHDTSLMQLEVLFK